MKEYKFPLEKIKELLKQMIILVDSREQRNLHILDYFRRQGIAYETMKLDYGDYSCKIPEAAAGQNIFFHDSIVIERKNSLEELSGNFAQYRDRFEMEFLKARNAGAKVYLMIEDPRGYTGICNHEYKTQLNPASYMASLKTWEHRFDTNVQFIAPELSGYFIASTFHYFVREALR